MTELLPPLSLLSVFVLASLVLAVTPGPGVLYIVTRSVAEGRAAGLASVIGVALGNLGSAVGASVGLAAIVSASSAAFDVVRYLGALYLFYLGWKALRTHGRHTAETAPAPSGHNARVVRDGFVVALLNPKTALFFAAFLPQFVAPGTAHVFQPLVLGALFVFIAASTDTLYALFASLAAPYFARTRSAAAARFAISGAYFGLGLFAVLSGKRGGQ